MIGVENCQLCGLNQCVSLISRRFNHPDIKGFIDDYYGGRVNWEFIDDEIFEVVKCQNCNFIQQKSILDSIGMAKLYNEWISSVQSFKKKKEASIQLYSSYARQAQHINSFFPERKPCQIKVLDYGCGWGYWCLAAKAHGYCVTGVEISDERVQFAKNNSLNIVCNLEQLSNQKFDFINAEQSLEHIPNPLHNLKDLVKFLSSNGIMRISVPNGIKIESELNCHDWKAKNDAIHPLEHINCFTSKTLIYMANKAGLRHICSTRQQKIKIESKFKEFVKKILGKPEVEDDIGTTLYFARS